MGMSIRSRDLAGYLGMPPGRVHHVAGSRVCAWSLVENVNIDDIIATSIVHDYFGEARATRVGCEG